MVVTYEKQYKQFKKQILKNPKNLKYIIDTITFLAQQNIALCGHRNDGPFTNENHLSDTLVYR